MPFVINCPTCHSPLTASEAAMPYVVACPSCRMPLTVPAISTVPTSAAQEPFVLPADEPRRRYRRRKGSSIGMTLLLTGIGLWVLSAALLVVGYGGAFKAAEAGDRNQFIAFVVPVYGGWCMGVFGAGLFFIGLLAIAVQAGVRDAQD